MNICGNGLCQCGGWTDDSGDWRSCDESQLDPLAEYRAVTADLIQRWYFWSEEHQVVLSVDQRTGEDERQVGVRYYMTPERADQRHAHDEKIRTAIAAGFLDPQDMAALLESDDPDEPVAPKPGPRGKRSREFPIKKKP